MPALKTWSAGEAVLAADLNANFAQINSQITLTGGAGEAISARDVVFVEDSVLTDLLLLAISPTTGLSGGVVLGGTGSSQSIAQSFQETPAMRVATVQISVKKTGAPSDDFVVAIQADNAGVPSGTDLATASRNGGSITGSFVNYSFSLSVILNLSASTKYWVVMRRSGGRDVSNYFEVSYNNGNANSYANGAKYTNDSGVWSSTGTDLNIWLYDQTIEGKVYKSSASAEYTKGVAGFAAASAAKGADISIIVSGIVSGFTGLSAGKPYYVDNTAGAIATSAGSTTRKIGIALSTTQLVITNVW